MTALGCRLFFFFDCFSLSDIAVKLATKITSLNKINNGILYYFLYICLVVLPKGGAAVLIEKKASFRLSDEVNLDNSRLLVRISEIKLAYECFCQIRIGGACSSVSY